MLLPRRMAQCDNTSISSSQPQLSPQQCLSTSLFVFDQLRPTFSMAQSIASLLTLPTTLAAAAAQSTCYLISLVHATNSFSTSAQLLPWRARSSSPHHHRGPCSISLLPLEVASPIFLLFFFTFSISLSADPSLCLENCRLSSQSYPLIQCTPSGKLGSTGSLSLGIKFDWNIARLICLYIAYAEQQVVE